MFPRWMQCQIRVCVSTVVAEIECLASSVKPRYLEQSREIKVTYDSLRKRGVQNSCYKMTEKANLREMDFHLTSIKLNLYQSSQQSCFLFYLTVTSLLPV